MNIDFIIRRYQNSDHDAVWTLHNLALEAVGAHAGVSFWDDDLHQIEEIYLNNGGEFLVGIYEGQIVAMGALKRISSDRAEIKRMRVHPDFQRRGLGQAIIQTLENRAVELKYTTLQLETTVQQIAAQKLYIKNGYVEVGRTKIHNFDVILYEKVLKV